MLLSPLGVSHVHIDGPSIAALDNNITFSVHILNKDEVLKIPYAANFW